MRLSFCQKLNQAEFYKALTMMHTHDLKTATTILPARIQSTRAQSTKLIVLKPLATTK